MATERHCTRRLFLGACGALTAARWGLAAGAGGKRPNIVFLLTDDHRWDALGCMGNRIIKTPEIDRLAGRGVVFENAFVTTSICCASRASIFTGQYARRHGVHGFNKPFTEEQFRQTYPQLLRRSGYRVGFIGKYGVGDNAPPSAEHFDYWKGFPGQGRYMQKVNGQTVHLTDVMAEQAEEFIGGCKADQPFCLSVSFKAPHAQDEDPKQYLYAPRHKDLYADVTVPVPPTAAEEYFQTQPQFIRESESRRRWELRFATPENYQEMVKSYFRLITGVDEAVGRIVAALRRSGLAENTVIMLMGDNGYYLGEHGLADKWFMHEESIRVPLVMYDPRLPDAQRGTRRREMVLNIDVAPTILELAGAEVPRGMQGRDLGPLVQGKKPAWRGEFFYEHLFEHKTIAKTEGVRTERWAYWRYLEAPQEAEWLHDVQNDPRETRNLAGVAEHQQVLAEMRGKVERYREALR
jgi:arylsulfatase A-like enzyme